MVENILLKTKIRDITIENKISIKEILDKKLNISGIYLIYNKINNCIYIGQAKNILKRWKSHYETWTDKRKNKKRQHIDIAIEKYGKDNFDCYILEICDNNSDILNKQEFYWASKYYECYIPLGYNIQICGESTSNLNSYKEVSNYDDNGNLIQTFPNITCAVEVFTNNIIKVVKENFLYHKASGYYWRYGHEKHIDLSNIKKLKTGPNGGNTIYRYDIKSGDYIDCFSNATAAVKYLNLKLNCTANIQQAAVKKIRSAYNFYWDYNKVSNIIEHYPYLKESSQKYKWRKVYQYDKQGNFIAEYCNLHEAAKALNISYSCVSATIDGKQKTCCGFYLYPEKKA